MHQRGGQTPADRDSRNTEEQPTLEASRAAIEHVLSALETKQGRGELRGLLSDIYVAQARLERECHFQFEEAGHAALFLEKVDPRLVHYMPYAGASLMMYRLFDPKALALAIYTDLSRCADTGVIIGCELATGRWEPKECWQPSFWTRIRTREPTLSFIRSGRSSISLDLDTAGARKRVVGKLGAESACEVDARLNLLLACGVATGVPEITSHSFEILMMFRWVLGGSIVIGYWKSRGLWPPTDITDDELLNFDGETWNDAFMRDLAVVLRGLAE